MRYVFGDYELDDQLYELRRAGAPVALDRKVFDVLAYLVQHRERLVTKEEMLDKLWPGQVVGEAALTRCITAARKALGDDGARQEFIRTQHGRGYRFVAAVTEPQALFLDARPEFTLSLSKGGHDGRTTRQPPTASVIPANAGIQEHGSPAPKLNPEDLSSAPAAPPPPLASLTSARPLRGKKKLVLAGALFLVSIVVLVWHLSRSSLSTQDSALRTDAAPAGLPLPDKPSIIVLPFVNLSGDPAQEYFSDGVTEDITSTLSRISSLFVIARTSAFTYKGKAAKVQDISREMGVRYVLEGSVRRTNDQLRIAVQLIDGATGGHLWSEYYDRPYQDIFTVQDEIVQRIITTLKLQLTLWEQGILVRKRTDNLEAYDYYLRGQESSFRAYLEVKKELNAQARQRYEKAIELEASRQNWPFKDPADLERHLAALRKAGLK